MVSHPRPPFEEAKIYLTPLPTLLLDISVSAYGREELGQEEISLTNRGRGTCYYVYSL